MVTLLKKMKNITESLKVRIFCSIFATGMSVKIANIVTHSKKHGFGDEFNIVGSCCDIIDGLPTLIIGVNEAKTCIENFNILKKTYDNGDLWWTYKKTERKCDYDDDTEAFTKYAINRFKSSIRYEYIDLLNYPLDRIKKLIRYIDSNERKKIMASRNGDFLFIYSEKYRIVFGLSLSFCEYCGIKKEKVINRIKKNRNNRFCYGFSNVDLLVRNMIGNDTHCLVPLL